MTQKSPSFQQQFEKLEKITEELEGENVDLDVGLKKFEEGLAIAQELKKRLSQVEQKIETIKEKFNHDNEAV